MNDTVPGASNAAADDALLLYKQGRTQRAAGDDPAAEKSYRHALALRPAFTDAWISLGILQKNGGRLREAEDSQRRAVGLEPGNFLAHLNLGNVLAAQGRDADAMREYHAALEHNAACADAQYNLGQLLRATRQHAAAAGHFAAALALRPDHFESALGLGQALVDAYDFEAALAPLEAACRLNPGDRSARLWLGRACTGAGRHVRAVEYFEALLREVPGDADVACELATALVYCGEFDRPRALFQALMEVPAPRAHHRFEYSALLLRAGEFRAGWAHYQARETRITRQFAPPRWQGESLAGRTLFVAREQGLGDEIMFASLLPEVLREAGHCIVECDARLAGLYRRSFPAATIVGVDLKSRDDGRQHASLPHIDCWTLLGDLARHRRNDARDFPRHRGYLLADVAAAGDWPKRLPADLLRVGIAWRGGVVRTRRNERSMTLEQLAPLLTASGVRFVSLQHGPHAEELAGLCSRHGVTIDHWPDVIDDLDACAALMSTLDVTITVCSSVAHLGGALGCDTWVLAPRVPEWRYAHQGDSMIWYPSVRMFRQTRPGDWHTPLARARSALLESRERHR